jgi:hypothetical protein
MGSFGEWDQFFYGIQVLFGLSAICQPNCVSVNAIIWLTEPVCLSPKMIPLSGRKNVLYLKPPVVIKKSIFLLRLIFYDLDTFKTSKMFLREIKEVLRKNRSFRNFI